MLRTADSATWQATLHTDSRAEKLAELAANNAAMLVFHDHTAGLQLRLKGSMATIKDTAERKAIWDALADSNRPNYRADPPTGSILGAAGDGIEPTDDRTGFRNFTVLTFSAATVDVLKLARSGAIAWTCQKGPAPGSCPDPTDRYFSNIPTFKDSEGPSQITCFV